MRNQLVLFCFITIVFGYKAKAQLTFNNGLTAQQIAQSLAGSGVAVSNATVTCDPNGIGSFTGNSGIGITTGVVLTTGSTAIISPNTNAGNAGVCTNTPGDSDLSNDPYDGCALEFDVVPLCDTLKFRYVFASEEYPEFVNQGVNDAFAFFISGPGIVGQPNIALIPGTSTAVSIDDLNGNTNSQFYVTNTGTTIEYDGYTTILTAWSVVQPCQTYHLKIVITDEGDCIYDSGVFLEAGSLQCQTTVSANATVQNAVEGCVDGSFEFCRPAPTTSPLTVNYTIAGSAANGTDYNTITNSITIPVGQLCASVPIVAIEDGVDEPLDSILIIFQPGVCPVNDTVKIYITDNALDAGPDDTLCSGGTVTIGTASQQGVTYAWSPATGLSNAISSNPSVTLTNTGSTPITTNYILTATNNGCSISDTVAVTVYPLAEVDAGPDQSVCSASIQLSGSLSGSATSGSWSGGTGTYAPANTSLHATYTPSAAEVTAGTVTLTLTSNDPPGPCPAATDQVTFTIDQQATIEAGPDQAICIGNSAILTGSFGGTATGGTWSGGNGTFAPDNTAPNAIYTPSSDEEAAGTFTLFYTAVNAGTCDPPYDSVVITINTLPTANAGSTQFICTGASATLAGAVGGTATSGTWSGGAGTFTPDNTTLNAVYTPSNAEYNAGSVTLTLTTDNPAGPCTASSSNVTINFYEKPSVNFSAGNSAGCPVHCTSFDNTSSIGSGSIVSWDWNFGDGSAGSTAEEPSNCYSTSGLYDVTLVATSNNGCVDSLELSHLVTVYDIPVAEFTTTPDPATILDPAIVFNNQSSSDVTSWHWNFGDGDTLGLDNPTPSHSYGDTANSYLVTLIVQNANGCKDTVQHEVVVGPAFTFYIPNAFSPNGDGFNDTFFGKGLGIDKYDLWIFDRWGNMIFHTKNLSDSWNGKANNGKNTAQIDVFAWKVEIIDVFAKKHSFIGTVSIVR
jgi:gliding motility-associated-like protein